MESSVLEIVCLNSRSGLILGESHRDFSDNVGILDHLDQGVANSLFEDGHFLKIVAGISNCEFGAFRPEFIFRFF